MRVASGHVGAVMCGRIWTPPDCNGLVGSGLVITIADVYPASLSGPIHRRREPRLDLSRFRAFVVARLSAHSFPGHGAFPTVG